MKIVVLAVKFGSTKFLNCICSYCTKIISNHECTQAECNYCRQYNEKTAFNCICGNCHFGEKGIKTKSKDNNINVILSVSIIFQFYLYYLLLVVSISNAEKKLMVEE